MECTRWHTNQQAYLEVIWKENKTDDVICLHFGVYGNICGHMIPSSENRHCVKIIVINNGMTKNYYGVYRSESKENPIVVLTFDLSASISIRMFVCTIFILL